MRTFFRFFILATLALAACSQPVNPAPNVPASATSSSQEMSSSTTSSVASLEERNVTYDNATFGFSFSYPSFITVKAPGGRLEQAKLRIVEDGNTTYVTTGTASLLEIRKNAESPWNDRWRMTSAKNLNNDAELLAFIRKAYGSGCGIESKDATAYDGTVDVRIKGNTTDAEALDEASTCPLNFNYAMKYSPSKHVAVTWKIGQDGLFWDETYGDQDHLIAESFRFH